MLRCYTDITRHDIMHVKIFEFVQFSIYARLKADEIDSRVVFSS